MGFEEFRALGGQDDMPVLAALASADVHRAGVGIEVSDL
jgi:hypothetical protein